LWRAFGPGSRRRFEKLASALHEWQDTGMTAKKFCELGDIARLVEAHPELWDSLTDDLKGQIEKPGSE